MDDPSGNKEVLTLLQESNKTLHEISKLMQIIATAAQAQNPDIFPNAKINRDRRKQP